MTYRPSLITQAGISSERSLRADEAFASAVRSEPGLASAAASRFGIR